MSSLQESITSWSSAISAVFGVIGLVQSQRWLVSLSGVFLVISIATGFYARRQEHLLRSALVTVEQRSIDALNLANLRRRVNRTLTVQSVERVATIKGSQLQIAATYAGFCRGRSEVAFEFSLNSDNNVPFDQLDCFAYDLICDPDRRHAIRPMLLGADGNAKKIAVPFLKPLAAQEPFKVVLICTLPGCMKPGVDYYAAALSFEQERIPLATVRLTFVGQVPEWLRVYEAEPGQEATLMRDLQPKRVNESICEYLDRAENVPGRSARIYLFSRDS